MIIKVIPFFSPLSSEATYNEVVSQLSIHKNQIIPPEQYFLKEYEPNLDDRHFLFVGTGGTENDIITFIQKSEFYPPIIILSYDSNNSLPAAMETRKYLDVQGIETKIIHGTLKELAKVLQEWTEFTNIETKLKEMRIGIFGVPSNWLIASYVNEKAIRNVWGVKIVSIPISDLIDSQNHESSERISVSIRKFMTGASKSNVTIEEVKEAGILTEKLFQFIQENQLDAITIECFSLLQKTDVTSCYALSYLNNQGIIAGCEGDIPSTFTMVLVRLLTGKSPFMANVVDVNKQNNTISLAHCTVPTNIVESYTFEPHFESGKSVAIRGQFKTKQEVTIVKIWGDDLTQWWVAEGKIISNLTNLSACRTQIELSLEESVEYFLENSLANHHILVLGNHKERIQRFLEFSMGF